MSAAPTRPLAPALKEAIRDDLVGRGDAPSRTSVAAAVRRGGYLLGDAQVLALADELRSAMVGLGPLEQVLADPSVTDVRVNGPGPVWVDRGTGLERSDARIEDEQDARSLAQRLATQAGRRLDDAVPWVDAALPGGLRLHAVLPPVAVAGTHVSLRVLPFRNRRIDDLQALGAMSPRTADLLRRIISSRQSFLVTGGTGTGKTTVLAAMLAEVPARERIVVVEDSAELAVRHPHVVQLQGRSPNVEGRGGVEMATLVRQALRMRPDRLVVGEVRGAEIKDMLAALNTGHDGGCATLHANSTRSVPARVEALAATAGIAPAAAASQFIAAISLVVHLVRRDGLRIVGQVGVVRSRDDGVVVESAVSSSADGVDSQGPAADELEQLLDCSP